MKLHLIFIGNKYIHNHTLKEYIIREVERRFDFIDSMTFFKEGDNSLFLYLEQELSDEKKFLIVTTKQFYATIGKVICTITEDHQILRDGVLIPSNSVKFDDRSYLLKHDKTLINVLQIDEMQKMPTILLDIDESHENLFFFDDSKESAIATLMPIAQSYDLHIDVITLINGWFLVDIKSSKYSNAQKFIAAIKELFSSQAIATFSIFEYIIAKLHTSGKTITFAESCTGGLLAYYFTKNNGASKIFNGSLVTYSNDLKENWLGVESRVVEKHGAVSSEVVLEMSSGALNVSGADYSISISGIAGDSGGTVDKPVGTVYIGVRSKSKHIEKRLNFNGDRNYIQHQSALTAIKLLLELDRELFFS